MKKKIVLTVLIGLLIILIAYLINSIFHLSYSIDYYNVRVANQINNPPAIYISEAKTQIVYDIFNIVIATVGIVLDFIFLIFLLKKKDIVK